MATKKHSQKRSFSIKVMNLMDAIVKNDQIFENACVNAFGVTTSQASVLLSFPAKDTLSMNELSSEVGVDTSTMTRMVDQLMSKNLVSRQADNQDRRIVRVGLTEIGFKLREAMKGAVEGFYKDSLDEIPVDKRAMIISCLEILNRAFSKGLENCCKKYCHK